MQKLSFDQGWQFHLGDLQQLFHQKQDDTIWRPVDLPHDWSIELERKPDNPSTVSGGFFQMGRGWYRKTFEVPTEWQGKQVYVEFEGVYMNAEIWLNHHFITRHPYGYTSFTVDLTPYLESGKSNELRVKVDNASQMNSRWYSGSGIYRHVWLMTAEATHIDQYGIYVTTPAVSTQSATVQSVVTVINDSGEAQSGQLQTRVFAPDGAPAGMGDLKITVPATDRTLVIQDVEVANPMHWSPDSPALYRLETTLIGGGQSIDSATTFFGIRSLSVDAQNGFVLNGQPVKLKGGCVHHDNGVMGAASYDRSEERKVELLKASGYNAIRCAHNPPAPAFLDACDRLGMLVIDEAFDCWREGKNPYDYHAVFDDWWKRDVESMVCRDRNHPSIVFWSIGNELVERGRPEGAEIARRLATTVRRLDPTRPVTAAMCGVWNGAWQWTETDEIFSALDVGGYNYLWSEYPKDHERQPERVMMGTESFPKEAFENWMSVLDSSHIIGDFVWTSLDYLGESGIGRSHLGGEKESFLGSYPWHQAYCGDLDLCGFKRPQSYYRDVLWGHGEPLYIVVHYPIPEGKTETVTLWGWPNVGPTWTFPGHEGQTFKVDVYSACERVELFLNGQSISVQPSGKAEKFTVTFDVPYTPGELKAVGYTGDQAAVSVALHTAGEPARLHMTPDRATIQAKKGDLSFVTVEILDGAGQLHPDADRPIHFTVMGEGTIAAVGSGDPTSTEAYRGNVRSTFHGRALVVVASNGNAGEIHLRAQADGVEGAEMVLQAS
jgi:beta-galactosidase